MDVRADSSAIALAVDLDGTLITGDLLVECMFTLIKRNPFYLFSMIFWLAQGKVRLKQEVFSRVKVDPEALLYRREVVEFILAERKKGRRVVLATASATEQARAIAGHLGCFDAVMGSTDSENLKSHAKARRLSAFYGEGGFDYMGNSVDDIAVFDAARKAIVVAPDKAARKWGKANDAEFLADEPPVSWKDTLKMMRVHQWAKNTLIAVPAILDHSLFQPAVFAQVVGAFFAFSFMASAVYIFNDLFDLQMDRRHPTKRNRPLAAGRISIIDGVLCAVLLLALSLVCASFLSPLFWAVLSVYFAATTAYSLRVKRFLLLDVLTLAGLYTVRVIAGAAATGIEASFWLLAFSVFFFLSLALVKRYVELDQSTNSETERLSGRGYRPQDKIMIGQAGMSSGFASVLVLALYLDSPAVFQLYAEPWLIWPLCPVVLYIIIRIWILAQRREFNEDPVVFIMTDWRSQIMVAAGALLLLFAGVWPGGPIGV